MKLDDVVEVNLVDRSHKETISTGQGNGCENYYGRCRNPNLQRSFERDFQKFEQLSLVS